MDVRAVVKAVVLGTTMPLQASDQVDYGLDCLRYSSSFEAGLDEGFEAVCSVNDLIVHFVTEHL